MSNSRNYIGSKGFTLVELMIALLLGVVVILVVSQIYLSGKQSYRTQTGFGGMQENGRFALFFLQRDIRMAGFPRVLGPGNAQPDLTVGFMDETLDGGLNGNDAIEIAYKSFGEPPPGAGPNEQFDASLDDCLGNETNIAEDTNGAQTVENFYSVVDGELRCRGSGNNAAQPIISGVESMQILYGEDTDGDTFANVYRRFDQVGNRDNIVAVRIGLLLNSQEPVYASPDVTPHAVLDAPPFIAADNPATSVDERLFARRVFTTTIQVRNRTEL